MKKLFLFTASLLLVSFSFTSCSSDDDSSGSSGHVDSENSLPVSINSDYSKIDYLYDSSNRITRISLNSHDGNFSEETVFTYDSNGKPSKATYREVSKDWYDEYSEYIFTYDADAVFVTDEYGRTSEIEIENNKLINGDYSYSYDENGNLTSGGGDVYKYDTSKKGIFSNTATPNWLLNFIGNGDGLYSPNLMIEERYGNYDYYEYSWGEFKNGLPTTCKIMNFDENEEPKEENLKITYKKMN